MAGDRDARASFVCLLWVLVAPLFGVLLAEGVFQLGETDDWELWKAAVLGLVLMMPFAVGAYLGVRGARRGHRKAWIGAVGNLLLAALAVGMPVAESLRA